MAKATKPFSANRYLQHRDKALLVFSSLLINVFALAVPLVTLQVYDRILAYKNFGTLQVLTAGIIVIVALDGVLKICRSTLIGWAAARFEHATFTRTLKHLMSSPLHELKRFSESEQLQRLSSIAKLKSFCSGQSLTNMIDLPFVVVFLGLIAYLAQELVFIPIALLAVFAVYAVALGRRMQRSLHLKEQNADKRTGFVAEILHHIHTVKMLGLEMAFQRRYEALQTKSIQDSYHLNRQNAHGYNMASLFTQIMMVSMVSFGAINVLNGQISMGVLVACVLLSGRIMQPVQRALSFWIGYQEYRLTQQKLAGLYDLPTQEIVTDLTVAKGKLVTPDLKLLPGKAIAITGLPSVEKSDYLKQLAGIYSTVIPEKSGTHANERAASSVVPIKTPSSSEASGMDSLFQGNDVLVDGLAPSQIPKSDVSQYIGYLSAETEIFQGSIMENITSFRPEKEPQAKEIASYLGIDKVVAKLAHGYETQLLDSPADPITPGVKQRIHIARILVNRPRILLFDYADKSLDKDGYNHLFRLLGQLKGQATMVLCSNDRNILHLASEEYRLENGALHLEEVTETQNQKSGAIAQPLRELRA